MSRGLHEVSGEGWVGGCYMRGVSRVHNLFSCKEVTVCFILDQVLFMVMSVYSQQVPVVSDVLSGRSYPPAGSDLLVSLGI